MKQIKISCIAITWIFLLSVIFLGIQGCKDRTKLTTVTIPEGTTCIEDRAFKGYTGLTVVTIPNGVTKIGKMAFFNCTGLKSITIPDTVTEIGFNAFSGCHSLTSITIPNSVTQIEEATFSYCTGLTSIIIPSSVTKIKNGAFLNCTNLTNVAISSSGTEIEKGAFERCPNLKLSVAVDNPTPAITHDIHPAFMDDLPRKVEASDGFSLNLPSNWTMIPKDALNAYSNAINKLAPNAEKQVYNCGAQLSSSKNELEYPYILIQVKRTGRLSENQLKSVKPVLQTLDNSLVKAKTALSPLLSDARVTETIYDPHAHILWTQINMDAKDIGKVKGLVGFLLTEEGVIQIAAYARDQDFSMYLPVFESIIRNTVITPSLRYKPRITNSTPTVTGIDWGKMIRVLVSVIIGLVVFVWVNRKLKTYMKKPFDCNKL